MTTYQVTIPPVEFDPDLVTGSADPKPVEFPFAVFWAVMLQSPLWDSENNAERIEVGLGLKGRVAAKAKDGDTFVLSKDERSHVLDVMAKMDLNPALRTVCRAYRLAVLRAKEQA